VEGELIERLANEPPKHWMVRFVQEALFLYHDKETEIPSDVIFLPGLTVANYRNSSNQLGFTVRHRDCFYPERMFMMTDNRNFREWIHHFEAYFNTSVQEKYTFKEEIGAGSHSIVLRCVKKQNQKEYALKIIDKQKLTEIERELIRSEVDIMSKCNHPNIIRLKETFETKTHLYIVIELVRDGDLFDFVTEHRVCTEGEAAIVAEDVLETVRYLNEQGLVHRDLKAENLMVTQPTYSDSARPHYKTDSEVQDHRFRLRYLH
jgi:tRNA A-37 threonylcarbamoyl transferase component Bud32